MIGLDHRDAERGLRYIPPHQTSVIAKLLTGGADGIIGANRSENVAGLVSRVFTVYPIVEPTAIKTTKKIKPRIRSSHEPLRQRHWNGFVSGTFRAT